MGEADVQHALERLAHLLDEKGIPYAVDRAPWRSTSGGTAASRSTSTCC